MTPPNHLALTSRTRGVVTLAVSTVLFASALALRERIDPWLSTAVAALVGIGLSAWALGRRGRALLALSFRGAAAAVLLGAALVALTHVGFLVVRQLSPDLAHSVRALYLSVDQGASRAALTALTVLIVLGEELIWRGVAVALGPARGRFAAGVISVALYVLPQLPGHVPVLIVAAAGLGTILTAQRLATGRITDPVITHAIWSVCVFVLLPVS